MSLPQARHLLSAPLALVGPGDDDDEYNVDSGAGPLQVSLLSSLHNKLRRRCRWPSALRTEWRRRRKLQAAGCELQAASSASRRLDHSCEPLRAVRRGSGSGRGLGGPGGSQACCSLTTGQGEATTLGQTR